MSGDPCTLSTGIYGAPFPQQTLGQTSRRQHLALGRQTNTTTTTTARLL